MSVFSLMKKGRQQAKEQNAKDLEKAKRETMKTPYKHIPTHAGTDALSGAPASSSFDYRSRIREQNRKRNSMTAAEMRQGFLPRASSSLSNASYSSTYTSPYVPVSRVHSFNSLPTWQQISSMNHTGRDYMTHSSNRKGKQHELVPPVPPLPNLTKSMLRAGSQTGDKRNGGSGNSSSSDDETEVAHRASASYNKSAHSNASRNAPNAFGTVQNPVFETGSQYIIQSHQRTISAQRIPRSHRFTAPRPIDSHALGMPGPPPSYSIPPVFSISPASSSPPMSNSYASSAKSNDSSAPTSAATTPAGSTISAFPSSDRLSSIGQGSSDSKPTVVTIKQRGSAVETKAPGEKKRKRWSFLSTKYRTATTA